MQIKETRLAEKLQSLKDEKKFLDSKYEKLLNNSKKLDKWLTISIGFSVFVFIIYICYILQIIV